jgi:tRNA-Thr(GGU) m(6)t(6)A37 methyltransferase TsaA
MTVCLEPIGLLRSDFGDAVPEGWESATAQIIIDERWMTALEGVEDFSHLIILFWLHGIPREGIELKTHPQGRHDLPLVGIFSTRTPYRPNPIGLQVVELVCREANVLTIRGIDAYDGSPILDIKPYLQRGDCVTQTTIPAWLKTLWGPTAQGAIGGE